MKEMFSNFITYKNINKLSNYLMNIGIALSIFNLIYIYISRMNLPKGACPINNNSGFIKLSIGISIIGLVLSFFGNEKK